MQQNLPPALKMYVPAKVWTVCTDLPPGQGNRWPIVSHWQLTERPTNRFWTEITANFVQKCPIFSRGDSEGLVIEIEEHGGGKSTWFDGEVKSGGKSRSGEGVLKIWENQLNNVLSITILGLCTLFTSLHFSWWHL